MDEKKNSRFTMRVSKQGGGSLPIDGKITKQAEMKEQLSLNS